MKILVCHRPGGAFGYISDSWMYALRDQGHDVRRWDGNENTWRDFGPDLYIGCSGHKQNIPTRRACKIAIHVNPYGPVNINGINEEPAAIQWVLKQNPDAVFGYGFEDDRLLWSYWTTKHNIPWVPMPTAGDKTFFKNLNQRRDVDIIYLGGRWTYKAITIDAFLLPVLNDKRMTSQLHGWGDWPPHVCQGILAEDKVVAFFNSGRVAPCISEQHTQNHGIDIPERVWKAALCGTLAIHDPIPTMRRELRSVIMAHTPEEMRELCYQYTRPENEEERAKLAGAQTQEVLVRHTYHHRLSGLFAALGWSAEAEHMLS